MVGLKLKIENGSEKVVGHLKQSQSEFLVYFSVTFVHGM